MTDDVREQRKNYRLGGITGKGFTPGRSGNPGGRPRGSKNLVNLLVQALCKKAKGRDGAEKEYYELLAESVVLNAAKGNAALVKLIFDYHEGPPLQKHELSGPNGERLIPAEMVVGLDDNTRTLLRELRGKLPRTMTDLSAGGVAEPLPALPAPQATPPLAEASGGEIIEEQDKP
jgi:hypothetical protein